jgi:ABC-type uncharacterized transport system substrate-binding protein
MLSGTEVSSILDFALTHRLPTAFENTQSVADGGFLSYGPDRMENARLAAGYVAKILQGTAPADLPVQQPTRFQLAVNLKTAKAIGLTIPPAFLDLADEVIEMTIGRCRLLALERRSGQWERSQLIDIEQTLTLRS